MSSEFTALLFQCALDFTQTDLLTDFVNIQELSQMSSYVSSHSIGCVNLVCCVISSKCNCKVHFVLFSTCVSTVSYKLVKSDRCLLQR